MLCLVAAAAVAAAVAAFTGKKYQVQVQYFKYSMRGKIFLRSLVLLPSLHSTLAKACGVL